MNWWKSGDLWAALVCLPVLVLLAVVLAAWFGGA